MSRKLTYDTWLFAAAMLLIVIGLVMIYSASAIITAQKSGFDSPYYYITRQCIWLIAGSMLMLAVMHIDLAILRDRRVIYALMFVALMALIAALFQPSVNGTHRWIALTYFRVQPSELAKPVIILFVASFLARRVECVTVGVGVNYVLPVSSSFPMSPMPLPISLAPMSSSLPRLLITMGDVARCSPA